ncbi:MAG: hypothetical protein NXI14_09600 [bacterium]|nr:hypothetical protein [bacterium]
MAALIVIPTALAVLVIWLIVTTPGRVRRKRLREAGVPLCWKCHARLDEVDEREEFCPYCRARINRFGSGKLGEDGVEASGSAGA